LFPRNSPDTAPGRNTLDFLRQNNIFKNHSFRIFFSPNGG